MIFILTCIVAPIVIYLFVAGSLRSSFAKLSVRRCQFCVDGQHPVNIDNGYGGTSRKLVDGQGHHGRNGATQAVFWPFTLPWTLGSLIGEGDRMQKKKVKSEARRAEEIAEAKHQTELAAIRAEEDAHLTRQLQDK